jgi:hypothetical protein
MTDEILPPVQQPTPEKIWTRCPACSTVMPNMQIAKNGHKENCPYEMRLSIKALEADIAALKGQLGGVAGTVESISAEPSVDLMGVAEWDDEEPQQHVIVEQTPTGAVQIPRIPSPYDDDEYDTVR